MMTVLSYVYRFAANLLLLAMVYFSLNYLERYQQRVIVAVLVLIYASMRTISALRSFYFYQRIERLEIEAKRLAQLAKPVDNPRRQIIVEVGVLRRYGEVMSYMDLFFLLVIVVLCLVKITSN
jgi:hypothetical protein